jgi:small subunit ribosomal protein S20
MPNHKSNEKRLKQDAKRRARNNFVVATIKTLQKKMRSNITVEEKEKMVQTIYSKLDKAAKKGVIHPRTASRRKSRIALYFNTQKTTPTENKE